MLANMKLLNMSPRRLQVPCTLVSVVIVLVLDYL